VIADPVPLAIDADLSLVAADGRVVTVTATGTVIDVTLPQLWSRHWAFGPLADRRQRQLLLSRLQRGLQIADLTLRFRVRHHLVAQLRPHQHPTRVSRLLGVGALEIYALPAVRALFGRAATTRSA
jgi:hypothetical protein